MADLYPALTDDQFKAAVKQRVHWHVIREGHSAGKVLARHPETSATRIDRTLKLAIDGLKLPLDQ